MSSIIEAPRRESSSTKHDRSLAVLRFNIGVAGGRNAAEVHHIGGTTSMYVAPETPFLITDAEAIIKLQQDVMKGFNVHVSMADQPNFRKGHWNRRGVWEDGTLNLGERVYVKDSERTGTWLHFYPDLRIAEAVAEYNALLGDFRVNRSSEFEGLQKGITELDMQRAVAGKLRADLDTLIKLGKTGGL